MNLALNFPALKAAIGFRSTAENASLKISLLCGNRTMQDKPRRPTVLFAAAADRSAEISWQPAADIYRTPDGWLIKYDLAGVKAEDIEIVLNGSQVTIRGLRRDRKLEEGCSYYTMEISYNRFERTIELPCDLAGAAAQLESREGILSLRLICQGEKK